MGPYCALACSGLALSTAAVSLASRWATASGYSVDARTFVAEAANIATFAALWAVQYRIADRILFRPATAPEHSPAGTQGPAYLDTDHERVAAPAA
jgi:hypothetical protein